MIDTVDLFANGATPVYYDDINLELDDGIPCPWDLDGSGTVGLSDLLELLAFWNDPYQLVDLLALLAAWGPCP